MTAPAGKVRKSRDIRHIIQAPWRRQRAECRYKDSSNSGYCGWPVTDSQLVTQDNHVTHPSLNCLLHLQSQSGQMKQEWLQIATTIVTTHVLHAITGNKPAPPSVSSNMPHVYHPQIIVWRQGRNSDNLFVKRMNINSLITQEMPLYLAKVNIVLHFHLQTVHHCHFLVWFICDLDKVPDAGFMLLLCIQM